MRYIAESFRRRKYESGGGFLWTLDEPWPNAAFCNLIDYYGVPKAAYYFVGRAYEPVHIGAEIAGVMLERRGDLKTRLWAGHEGADGLSGIRYSANLVRISDGRLIGRAVGKLTLRPDQSKYLRTLKIPLKSTKEGDILGLFLRLVDSKGNVQIVYQRKAVARCRKEDEIRAAEPARLGACPGGFVSMVVRVLPRTGV